MFLRAKAAKDGSDPRPGMTSRISIHHRTAIAPNTIIPLLLVLLAVTGIQTARSETALDLSDRIVIDGFSGDFVPGEEVFGFNELVGDFEESSRDSKWGPFKDLNQIKITWDRENLYVALDGFSADRHNFILLFDVTDRGPETTDDDGLTSMTELNSWRRNFVFSADFTPDLFLATWDGNVQPQVWTWVETNPQGNEVDQVDEEAFQTVATFEGNAAGRSMEAAIPWKIFFLGDSLRTDHADLGDVPLIPAGMDTIRFAGVITDWWDGAGGADSAPDNFGGHTSESSDQVTIDNFAVLPLDLDGIRDIPDFGIEPKSRISFKQRPPILGKTYEIPELTFDRDVVSPEEDKPLVFRVDLDPTPVTADSFRTVILTAKVYDSLGKLVRTLYTSDSRDPTRELFRPELDLWDGRDSEGRMVPGGIYVLSVVSEPGLSRSTKAFGVVR